MRALTVRRLRRLDRAAVRRYGIPALLLMENAAAACREEILKRYPRAKKTVIVCGKGNNGGDGFALARQLRGAGLAVIVAYFGAPGRTSPDALVNFRIVRKLKVPMVRLRRDARGLERALRQADLAVDAIFGTGLTREATGLYRDAIRALNASGRPVVSMDIPSGLDADSGRVLGEAVRADLCVTLVAPKLGFKKAGAWTGRVVVRDIGVRL